MKLFSALAVLVVITLGVWFFVRSHAAAPEAPTTTPPQSYTTENNVQVTKTDITENGVSSLPVGFPTDMPVETNNITESYRVAYKDKGVTQYTVSYTSLKNRDTLWSAYSDYMNKSGYAVDKNSTSKSLGQIYGSKGSNTLSVLVSDHSGLSLVQINYLER